MDINNHAITDLFLTFLIPSTIKLVQYNRILKKKERKWMLEEMLLANIGMINFIQIPIQLMNIRFEVGEQLYSYINFNCFNCLTSFILRHGFCDSSKSRRITRRDLS